MDKVIKDSDYLKVLMSNDDSFEIEELPEVLLVRQYYDDNISNIDELLNAMDFLQMSQKTIEDVLIYAVYMGYDINSNPNIRDLFEEVRSNYNFSEDKIWQTLYFEERFRCLRNIFRTMNDIQINDKLNIIEQAFDGQYDILEYIMENDEGDPIFDAIFQEKHEVYRHMLMYCVRGKHDKVHKFLEIAKLTDEEWEKLFILSFIWFHEETLNKLIHKVFTQDLLNMSYPILYLQDESLYKINDEFIPINIPRLTEDKLNWLLQNCDETDQLLLDYYVSIKNPFETSDDLYSAEYILKLFKKNRRTLYVNINGLFDNLIFQQRNLDKFKLLLDNLPKVTLSSADFDIITFVSCEYNHLLFNDLVVFVVGLEGFDIDESILCYFNDLDWVYIPENEGYDEELPNQFISNIGVSSYDMRLYLLSRLKYSQRFLEKTKDQDIIKLKDQIRKL